MEEEAEAVRQVGRTEPWAKEHGHTHWVREQARLEVFRPMGMARKP